MSTDETSEQTTSVVPFVRGTQATRYDTETKVRCFFLFSTAAGRNIRHTARLIAEEMRGTGEPAPTHATIALWAADEQWHLQADDIWRNSKTRTAYELQVLANAAAVLGMQRVLEMLVNADLTETGGQFLALKNAELALRVRERMPELARIDPPASATDDDTDKPRDQLEADAKAAMIQRKTARGTG